MDTELHVAIWRRLDEKLGLRLALNGKTGTVRIIAVSGNLNQVVNERCRSSGVRQLVACQLEIGDWVVCVNGKTDPREMLSVLLSVDTPCCHIRLRREFSAARAGAKIFGVQAPVASAALLGPSPPRMPNHNGPYAESGFSNSDALAGPTAPGLGALAQQPEGSPSVPASSTTAAAVARRRGPKLRIIANYNPWREPEHGYLGVDEGSIVVVMPGSQAPADSRSMFACDYVFAWRADRRDPGGWLPIRVLDGAL